VTPHPIAPQDAHDEGIADAAVDRTVIVAQAAFDLEAELLIGVERALILDEKVEVEAVGLGLRE
jgi:hypothetical protein